MIKAVVIDDDPGIRELNQNLLKEYFGHKIEVVGQADSVDTGINVIRNTKPHLVLLDIDIKGGNGFEILQQLRPYSFKIVFITAFNNFAIKALKFNAIDYIVKPINEVEFQQSIQNAIQLIETCQNTQAQADNLLESFQRKGLPQKKMVLRTAEALHIVNIAEVMYCKSDNSYTTFHLVSGEEIIVSKALREYSDLLGGNGFFRPHQSYLVNLNFVKKVDKSDGGFVIMKNKAEIPLSSRQKKKLIDLLEKW